MSNAIAYICRNQKLIKMKKEKTPLERCLESEIFMMIQDAVENAIDQNELTASDGSKLELSESRSEKLCDLSDEIASLIYGQYVDAFFKVDCPECSGTGQHEERDCSVGSASICCGACFDLVQCEECCGTGFANSENS